MECCERVCATMCTVVQAAYSPCATATSGDDIVHGLPARAAMLHLRVAYFNLAKLKNGEAIFHTSIVVTSCKQ